MVNDLKQLSVKLGVAQYQMQCLYLFQNMKQFIRAEETQNWKLSLKSVRKMFNNFTAAGHMQSAILYLQKMMELRID